MTKKTTHFIRGKLKWPKILGKPVPNYNKDGYEWTFDLVLDDNGVKQVKAIPELKAKLKQKDGENVITFKQKELRSNGEPNKPIRVLDANNKPWDQDVKIGNDSVADVKVEVWDFGKGRFAGIYPKAVRVVSHVEYGGSEFPELSPDDEFFSNVSQAEKDMGYIPSKDEFLGHTDDEDLDDEIPGI